MIEFIPSNSTSLSSEDIQRLYDLMIHAYAVTELNIWGENYIRCPLDEYQELLDKGEIIIAKLDGKIVGSIHTYPLSPDRYAFGMLNADFDLGGQGIGSGLIRAAEDEARKNGASIMQLEILRTKEGILPEKEMLRKWYTKLGYEFQSTEEFLGVKPDKQEKAKKLIAPSCFDVYIKRLG